MTDHLNEEEKDVLESFNRGEWKSALHLDEREEELKEYAKNTHRKDKRLNSKSQNNEPT